MRGFLIAVSVLCFAAGGALAQQRDTGGKVMDLSKWHAMPVQEFMVNIVDLPGVEFVRAQRRVRDNRANQERIRLDAAKGAMFAENFPIGHYSENTTNLFQDAGFTRKFAERFWRDEKEGFAVEDKRKVYRFGERAGWVFATRGKESGRLCLISRMGFLADGAKAGRVLYEVYDTGLIYRDCSGRRSIEDVAKWLEGAKIVEPPYNRVASK